MRTNFRNAALTLALLGGAALIATPSFAADLDDFDGPGANLAPAYAPDIYPPEFYPVPYAPVSPPDAAEIYGPPYLPPPGAYLPPQVEEEDYGPGPAIIVGD